MCTHEVNIQNPPKFSNFNIIIETTPANYLINLITLGLANGKTFQIKGDVVKAPEGLSSLDGGAIIAQSKNLNEIISAIPPSLSPDGPSYMIVRHGTEGETTYSLTQY